MARFYIREHITQKEVDEFYEYNPHLFSIKLHHGGVFTKFPDRMYVDGKATYVDLLDSERFSVHELDCVMTNLGYETDIIRYYHYLVPNHDLDFGLRALGGDQDVISFVKFTSDHKIMSVYTEFETTNVHTYFCSPSKMSIEELSEDVEFSNNKKTRLMLGWHETIIDEEVANEKDVNDQDVNVQEVTQETVSMFSQYMDDSFDPFFGEYNVSAYMNDAAAIEEQMGIQQDNHTSVKEKDTDEPTGNKHTNEKENEDDEDQDSDFVAEEDRMHDVDVDMRDFHINTDGDINNQINAEVDDNIILDNDILESGSDTDEDGTSARKKLLKHLRRVHANDTNFYIGQVFGNKVEAKKLIKELAVVSRRELKIIKDDATRVRAVCEGELPNFEIDGSGILKPLQDKGCNVNKGKRKISDVADSSSEMGSSSCNKVKNLGGRGKKTDPEKYQCPWMLYIGKETNSASWMVKTFRDVHTCLQSRSIKHCTAAFLANKLLEQIEENPNIPVKAVQEQFQRKYQVSISRMKAFRAKNKAITHMQGDYQSQYSLLRDYVDELMKTNPGTTVKIEVEQQPDPNSTDRKFKRIYVCLGSLKQGFKAIGRDLLGLDGAFIKGPYPGQVLSAVGIDPNNGIYPLAYAIVEAENYSSWTWFLECLGDDLDLEQDSNFTFVSDRQKGILPALAKVFPCAEHRYCLRHIHENMKLQFRGKAYKDLLWKLAKSTSVVWFEKQMVELKTLNTEAQLWLSKIDPKHWSLSHFSGRAHSDVLLNNMCEVFNSKIVDGRDKPLITLLEFIREYLMRRIVNVLTVIDGEEGLLTPYASKLFEEIERQAAKCTVSWNGEDHYQVMSPGGEQYVVDMNRKTCVCRRWEITGMPCKHAVAAIWLKAKNEKKKEVADVYVHPVYTMQRWKEVYKFKIFPINGKDAWHQSAVPTTIKPPTYHKPIGRPKKQRKKSAIELEEATTSGKLTRKGTTKTCSKCHKKGHNSRSCKGQEE